MEKFKCNNCDEVMGISCTEDIEHCPTCGCNQSLSPTNEPVPEEATIAQNWEHVGYDGCGAVYTVVCVGPVEYCPNCNGQNG